MFIPRNIFIAIVIACAGLLITAIFIEPFKSMNPCPMCIMQRIVFFIIGILALVAAIHNPKTAGLRGYSSAIALVSIVGAAIAARQVWLQNLPEELVPACGPGLEYMFDVFPVLEALEMALRGTGDCAEVQWTFLTLSIPGWSFLAFSGFIVLNLWVLFNTFSRRNQSAA